MQFFKFISVIVNKMKTDHLNIAESKFIQMQTH